MTECVEYKVAPTDQPPRPAWDLIEFKATGDGKIIASFYDARMAERVMRLLSKAASGAKPRSGDGSSALLARRVSAETTKRAGSLPIGSAKSDPAGCMDCGKRYDDFKLDTLFSREDWLAINPQSVGLLCANCMVKRAAELPRVVSVRARIQYATEFTDSQPAGAAPSGQRAKADRTGVEHEAAFYLDLLKQIAADPRKTRARRLAESGIVFWDSLKEESAKRKAVSQSDAPPCGERARLANRPS